MIFHFGFERPERHSNKANEGLHPGRLEERDVAILKKQIQRNSRVIDEHIARLDLFLNKERYPNDAAFIQKLRRHLFLLMEENDTFRKVLWRHMQGKNRKTAFFEP